MPEIDVSFLHGEPTRARLAAGVTADIEEGVATVDADTPLYNLYSDDAHRRMREELLAIPKIEEVVIEE